MFLSVTVSSNRPNAKRLKILLTHFPSRTVTAAVPATTVDTKGTVLQYNNHRCNICVGIVLSHVPTKVATSVEVLCKYCNATIRQQIGVEESIIKETEQKQLTWYGHVQRMAEERLLRIALRWIPKQKRARGRQII
jgi:hypothetical protein